MKHKDIIRQMTLKEKCYLLSGKDFWQTRSVERLNIPKGTPDLNITFIYNMPFWGIAKMAGGMCTMEMAEGILIVVNGHFFKWLGWIIGGFFRSGKKRKAAAAVK